MKKYLTNEKYWHMAGVALGLAVILVGIIFMCTPAESYHTRSADDVSFGGDFYTYQYEATRYAVSNTAVTANNIRELGAKITLYSGFGFLVAGALICLTYGRKLALCILAESAAPEAPESGDSPSETDTPAAE